MENYKTKGVCSVNISYDIDSENRLRNVSFKGGCDGNLKAISKLVEGMPINEVVTKLEGITCGMKKTSCSDQLALALKERL